MLVLRFTSDALDNIAEFGVTAQCAGSVFNGAERNLPLPTSTSPAA